jgi:hypothetical protein
LESKADIKKRGMASPDVADAIAVTFAYPVANKAAQAVSREMRGKRRNALSLVTQAASGGWMN